MAYMSKDETNNIFLNYFKENIFFNKLFIVLDNKNNYQIEFLKIKDGYLSLLNRDFIIERITIIKHLNLKILFADENNVVLYEEDLLFQANFFNKLIDLSRYNSYFPFYDENNYIKPEKIAVITLSNNDNIFIKIFFDYYSKITNKNNLYIIDHGSDFRSDYFDLGMQRIYIPKGYENELNKLRFMEYFQRFLLNKYEWIIKVDLDEIILYKNGPQNILKYLENINCNCIIKPSSGYNVLHNYQIEDEIDLNKLITTQRNHLKFDNQFCKPAISNYPVNWSLGFHESLNDEKILFSDDFCMLHLARISINERHRRNQLFYTIKRTQEEINIVTKGKSDEFISLENIKKQIDIELNEGYIEMPEWIKGQF